MTKAEVAVDVQDTGVGMSSEQLKTLFEPFARLGYETSRIEGTGIGLTISKRLMELMHGRLQVESAPGQGSTFTAVLPGVWPAQPRLNALSSGPAQMNGGGH